MADTASWLSARTVADPSPFFGAFKTLYVEAWRGRSAQ